MATYIAPIGNGLGDLVVSLPAVQYLISTGEAIYLVLRSPRQEGFPELIPGLAGVVREVDMPAIALQPEDRVINLREHPLQTDHVWGSAEFEAKYPDYKIADIVCDIGRDFGILADYENLLPLPFEGRKDVDGTVLFIPGSDGLFKCWLKERWLELAQRLQANGQPIAVVGQPEKSLQVKELIDAGLPFVETPTLRDALNVVSSASAVVSIDTGLLHLSLQQLVPTVGIWINNPGSLNYSRTLNHCFVVVSPRCRPACVSEELDKNLNMVTGFDKWCGYDSWNCHASAEERCMNNVSVDAVFAQLTGALQCSSPKAGVQVSR